jgi:hypothetical protein
LYPFLILIMRASKSKALHFYITGALHVSLACVHMTCTVLTTRYIWMDKQPCLFPSFYSEVGRVTPNEQTRNSKRILNWVWG